MEYQTKESVWLSRDYTVARLVRSKNVWRQQGQQPPSTYSMPRWPDAVLAPNLEGGAPTLLIEAEQEVEARGLENPLKGTVKAVFPSLVSLHRQPGSSGKMTSTGSLTRKTGACCDGLFQEFYRSEFSHTAPMAWNNKGDRVGWTELQSRVLSHCKPGSSRQTASLKLSSRYP